MANQSSMTANPHDPAIYEIRLRGQLGAEWAEWFGGATVRHDGHGETLITSQAVDQAGLHGLLKKVRDLGMPLISVNCVER